MFQKLVMRLDGCRHGRLHGSQIIEFIDHCDIQVRYAGLAVSTVGTFSAVGMQWGIGKYGCIVLFLFGSILISSGSIDLSLCVISAHNGTDSRTCQRIVDTLDRCQGYSKRRAFFIKKPASGKALHNGDSHIILFADII